MFLDLLRRRNPAFIEAAMALHQAGKIPANAYVFDLDAVEHNARVIKTEADKYGLKVFAMTKQVGRSSSFSHAVMRGGISRSVAVDMACAKANHVAGLAVGHLGHLVQIPKFEASYAAKVLQPDYWTVFNLIKAGEAAAAAKSVGRVQNLMARIYALGDTFYQGHEGGFSAAEIVQVADTLDALDGGQFAGITTFPALLFDDASRQIKPTPNLATLNQAAEALAKAGRGQIEINAPGTTSSIMLKVLADAGATQCEPGNGLHGTTPLHALQDLPELPAMLYLSEVSHLHGDKAYCFGGGLYVDPVFPDYNMQVLVGDEPVSDAQHLAGVQVPPPAAIDYYAMIDATGKVKPKVGDSVVFGFRGQAFVTRAYVIGISGTSTGNIRVESIENSLGEAESWPLI